MSGLYLTRNTRNLSRANLNITTLSLLSVADTLHYLIVLIDFYKWMFVCRWLCGNSRGFFLVNVIFKCIWKNLGLMLIVVWTKPPIKFLSGLKIRPVPGSYKPQELPLVTFACFQQVHQQQSHLALQCQLLPHQRCHHLW